MNRLVLTAALLSLGMGNIMADKQANQLPSVDDPVYMNGSPRPKAPNGWPAFDWETKKGILLGQYAPTEEEKSRILAAMPKAPAAQPAQPRQLLVFYQCQYPHAAIASCNFTIEQMGKTSGAFTTELTDDPAVFTAENLKRYDAVLFNNNTTWEKTLNEDQRNALLEYVRQGGGFIGIHAASDSCKNWKEGQELIGAVFAGHPWVCKQAWAFKIESPQHILNQCFGNAGFWHCEEIYAFQKSIPDRSRSRVLVSVDMSQKRNVELLDQQHRAIFDKFEPGHLFDVAWIHSYGKGRVFYSSLGHNFSTYWQPKILAHYLAGIQFAMGDIDADMTPSSQLKETQTAPAPNWQ